MSEYRAPLRDIRFVLNELLDWSRVQSLSGFGEFDTETTAAVLEEAGRFAGEVLAPLNQPGDEQGATWTEAGVRTADGFVDAYRQYVEGGWNGVTGDAEFDGMGMPAVIGTACQELWNAANMSFALCPTLSASGIELLEIHGSDEQRNKYLRKLVTGEWTGTMDLTEPQAGSDLGALRTKAEPAGDHYLLSGQKIFISWGEHDMAENIIHFVLARTPDAPAGSKGISLFIVPRFLVNEDGSIGERNDMRAASIEHKMGIHASPTCAMTYGENEGAVGYLVGEENKGLSLMFTMMNEARHKMGIEALGLSDRAYQRALAYARDRIQGKPMHPQAGRGAGIIYHPDVARMLMTMKCQTEAIRELCYETAMQMDIARRHEDGQIRRQTQARVDLLIPLCKAWCTELGVEITSLGIQVHGGMGYVEETGAAQYLRDARITTIYEGTNGIQAKDLVDRKLLRDQGHAMNDLIEDMRATLARVKAADFASSCLLAERFESTVSALRAATDRILADGASDQAQALTNAFNYLMLAGYAVGGWYAVRKALTAQQVLDSGTSETDFYQSKLATSRFYAAQVMPRAQTYEQAIAAGPEAITAIDPSVIL